MRQMQLIAKGIGKKAVYQCPFCPFTGTPHSVKEHRADSCVARLARDIAAGKLTRG